VADEIGLFERLHSNPSSTDDVAQHYGMSPHAAEALLGVLASKGHLVQHKGLFHLTESSREFLLPGSPYYCGAALALRRQRPIDHTIIKEILFRKRSDASPVLFDTEMWQDSEAHIERHKASTASMHALFFPTAMAVAKHGDFQGVRSLLDVAGGSGCFCIALAMRYPNLRLTVMELPAICALVKEYAQNFGVRDRIETSAGDMFKTPFPQEHDAHFYSNVFHDWDAEKCRFLAAKSFDALPSGGRIYLHESLLNDTRDGPPLLSLYSMNMARVTEYGKQYSAADFEQFLLDAGFTGVRVTQTYSIFSLVSAYKR
jgi:cyclopropane fatty-acyl-phospholipid synthase-like methyltransferase